MTITTNRIEATEPTEAEIESAILPALAPSGENLVPWAKVRDHLPGELLGLGPRAVAPVPERPGLCRRPGS
jgi:hypothetical protein